LARGVSGEAQSGRGRTAFHYGDGGKPEFVAGLVLQAIEEGQGAVFRE
jgi:hypothetical protein